MARKRSTVPNLADSNPVSDSSRATRSLIRGISDDTFFERLAASVLRVADPIYKSLIETGTNAEGKTINDVVDGIVFSEDQNGARYAILVHHTTTSRDKLRGKWLDETGGDLYKAYREFEKQKALLGDRRRRVVLTTTLDPSSLLATESQAAADALGVELDLWPNSRLAHVLDTDADGQWVRKTYFNRPQQRLSIDLARDLGIRTLEMLRPAADPAEYIRRNVSVEIQTRLSANHGVIFVSGSSGNGKSVLCYDLTADLMRQGCIALGLSEKAIENAFTLEQALQNTCRAFAPDLAEADLVRAFSALVPGSQVIVWIDDINRAASPVDLIRKVLSWNRDPTSTTHGAGKEQVRQGITLLCPIWPDHLPQLTVDERKAIDRYSVVLDGYSVMEGGAAVLQRSQLLGGDLTPLEAHNISYALGHDPLLIGLVSNWTSPRADDVLENYLGDEYHRLAAKTEFEVVEFRIALLEVARILVERCAPAPLWEHVTTWVPEQTLTRLRKVLRYSSIAHVNSDGLLQFRHDRVRDHLFSSIVAEDLSAGTADPLRIADPFFARVIGPAMLKVDEIERSIDIVSLANPLALVHGFGAAVRGRHPFRQQLFHAISAMLVTPEYLERPLSERYAINSTLAELDGEDVRELLVKAHGPCFARMEGLARNGDARQAANLCYHQDPFVTSPRRDRLIVHTYKRHGQRWVDDIASLVIAPDISEKQLEGVLHLAGELGSESLVPALKSRWSMMQQAGHDLDGAFLFASVTCGAGRDDIFLQSVFEAWDRLPDKDKDEKGDAKFDVARYALTGGILRHETDRVVNCLVNAIKRFPNLKNPIVWVLHRVDHPTAVQVCAITLGEVDARVAKTKGINLWSNQFLQVWGENEMRGSRRMGDSSRAALKTLWSDIKISKFARKRAFQMATASLDEGTLLDISSSVPKGFEDLALVARVRHGDVSARPALIHRVLSDEHKSYWLQFARHIGTQGMEAMFAQLLNERRQRMSESEKRYDRGDDYVAALLCDRDDAFALRIIAEHWDHLSGSAHFVGALLYLATDESLRLADEAIKASSDPVKLFEHIHWHMGIHVGGRAGLKRIAQAAALLKYWELLSERTRSNVWEECNRRGWFEWRRKHLDDLMLKKRSRANEEADFVHLDHLINDRDPPSYRSDIWIRHHIEEGMSVSSIIDRAERFAASRRTSRSYAFLGAVIAELGGRSDLPRLQAAWTHGIPEIAHEAANSAFSVKLRSAS